MRPSTRKALLWQGVGMLFYLFGMVLFLAVAVGAFLAPPENSFANMTTGDIAIILVSVALLVTGRTINWKYGGEASMMAGMMGSHNSGSGPGRQDPDQTKLEQLGYHVPPESTAETGEAVDEDDEIEGAPVVCTECGARNSGDFRFCRECSSELSS